MMLERSLLIKTFLRFRAFLPKVVKIILVAYKWDYLNDKILPIQNNQFCKKELFYNGTNFFSETLCIYLVHGFVI